MRSVDRKVSPNLRPGVRIKASNEEHWSHAAPAGRRQVPTHRLPFCPRRPWEPVSPVLGPPTGRLLPLPTLASYNAPSEKKAFPLTV